MDGLETHSGSLDPVARKRVFKTVLAAHLALLLALSAGFFLAKLLRKPKMEAMRVTLVAPASTSSSTRTTATPPTPRPTPLPAPKEPNPIKSPAPAPKPKPPRPKPRPVAKPPKKTANQRTATRKPAKPKWKPRKEITISRKVVRKNTPAPHRTQRNTRPPRRLTAAEIERALREGRIKTTSANTSAATASIPLNYYDKVSAVVYSLWRQPSKADLNASFPSVVLTISVDAAGRVMSAKISRRSGNAAMDASAARLARDLRELPKPPGGAVTFAVTLEVVE